MARFHIGKSGKSAACNARKGNCPLGGDSDHYKTREEANTAAEKKMGDKYNPTSSASKTKSSPVNKSEFSIPKGFSSEGYMGGRYWEGGNLERLIAEKKARGDGSYVDNREITSALRGDIKKAVEAGHLPSSIDGNKYKYSVARDGSNGIYMTAKIEGATTLDISSIEVNPGGGWSNSDFISLRKGNEQTTKLDNKMREMLDSYRYDGSNSQVDYFDTNFYPHSKIEANGDFGSVARAEQKLNRALIESAKNGEIDVNMGSEAAINQAIKKNPKVRKALLEYSAANEYYNAHRDVDKVVYETNRKLRNAPEDNGFPSHKQLQDSTADVIKYKDARSEEVKDKVEALSNDLDNKSSLKEFLAEDTYESRNVNNKFQNSLERAGLVRRPRKRYGY